MARSRANSMASRRGSRAPSHVTVAGQDVVAVPADFSDDFFAGDWLNDPNLDLDLDLSMYNFEDFDIFDNTAGPSNPVGAPSPVGASNNVGPSNQFIPFTGFGTHYVQVAAYDQYGYPLMPGHQFPMAQPMLGSINSTMLSQQPYGLDGPTPGLTAVPGAADLMPMQPTQYAEHNMFVPQPYYQPYQQTGYSPIEEPAPQQAPQEAPAPASARQSRKRSLSSSDSEDEAPVSKRRRDLSSSPEIVKRARRQSRDSGFSSESTYSGPAIARAGQRPEKDSSKPWVRINGNTKGETTRTARINAEAAQHLGDKYKCKPLPLGDWKSRKFEFEYTNAGGLDEFKQKKMSARQITEYITQYPTDDLRLWLQVAPADMARRYGSPAHSKCLFEDCPKHTWHDNGTIDVGHYRVAFDEKFKVYGHNNKTIDPFDCPGFVHLYCLERFCDFEYICAIVDVEVDTRCDLPREISQAKWTMSGRPEAKTAERFIQKCKSGKLRTREPFAQYPVHVSSHAPKAFDGTLASILVGINIDARTRSQMRQFIDRKLTPNVLMINRGDMEIAMTQKKIKASKVYKKAIKNKRATAASFDFEAYYDKYDPVINERIRTYRTLKAQYDAEEEAGTARHRSKGKATAAPKPKRAAVVDSDEESDNAGPSQPQRRRRNHHNTAAHDSDSDHESVTGISPRTGTRVSLRQRQRINYADDEQPQPQRPSEPYLEQGYHQASPLRRESLSAFFPTLRQDDPSYEARTLNADQLNALMDRQFNGSGGLSRERRKSSMRFYAGIIKAQRRNNGRQASFAAQPVSAEQEYNVNDPPSRLVATPTHVPSASHTRRSSRLARHYRN
jgi:hypothetical protein